MQEGEEEACRVNEQQPLHLLPDTVTHTLT